jgi:hypothetical protein
MTAPVYRACYVCGFKPRARLMRSPTCPPCSAWFAALPKPKAFDFDWFVPALRARRKSLGLPHAVPPGPIELKGSDEL